MKRIAVISKQMVMGGVEKCLINMLEKYASRAHITLFLMSEGGELREEIPENVEVKIMPDIALDSKKRLIKALKTKGIKESIRIFKGLYKIKKEDTFFEQCRLLSDILPINEEEYDIAISYSTPISFPVIYTLDNIKASKKYLWIHTDVEKMGISLYEARNEYSRYDKIYCVSTHIKEQLERLEPELLEKVFVAYNCININNIKRLSLEPCEEQFEKQSDQTRIVTVGRLSIQKGQDWIVDIAQMLKENGVDFCWFLVGNGEMREALKEKISEKNLEERVILLGNKDNPYPYINGCDIYVQPSRYEGYCTTTNEAKVLGKIVITTDVSGAREQFMDRENGIIVPIEKEAVFNAILEVLKNRQLREKISENLRVCENEDTEVYKKIFGEER